MSNSVTVAVKRQVRRERTDEATAWAEDGLRLARSFNGCLGGGVMRDTDDESVLHVIYRFTDEDSLAKWEHSAQRRRWLADGSALIIDSRRVQPRTGIEGWFDAPQLRESIDARTGETRVLLTRSAPVRWKQAVAIWLGMFPVNMLFACLVAQLSWWDELPIPVRSAVMVTVLAPTMTFLVMPNITRVLRHWLRRDPGMIETQRSLFDALDSKAANVSTPRR